MNFANYKTATFNFLRRSFLQYPVMEAALARVVQGKSPTHWLSKLAPNPGQYAPDSIRVIERGDLRFELDLSDLMEWSLFYDFADTSAENLLKLCAPGDFVMDVGANIGAMLFKAASRVGDKGWVYGFEPDPGRFAKCARNLGNNGIVNVQLFPLALGESFGGAKIKTRNSHNQGMNQIVPQGQTSKNCREVTMTTLDTFCLEREIKRVDVIKIDVEGYEFKVLKGASKTLSALRPRLFIEVDDFNLRTQGSSPAELIEYLRDLDYRLYAGSEGVPLPELDACHFDLVCLPGRAR